MKKGEAETAMPTLCDKWAKEEKQPWPPNGKYHYSFSQFWSWLENHHHPYTQFRPFLMRGTWQRCGLTGLQSRLGATRLIPARGTKDFYSRTRLVGTSSVADFRVFQPAFSPLLSDLTASSKRQVHPLSREIASRSATCSPYDIR